MGYLEGHLSQEYPLFQGLSQRACRCLSVGTFVLHSVCLLCSNLDRSSVQTHVCSLVQSDRHTYSPLLMCVCVSGQGCVRVYNADSCQRYLVGPSLTSGRISLGTSQVVVLSLTTEGALGSTI